jgi:hypothetical protein
MNLVKMKKAYDDLIAWIKAGFAKKADLTDGKVPITQGGSPIIITATEPTTAQVTAAPEGTVWMVTEN